MSSLRVTSNTHKKVCTYNDNYDVHTARFTLLKVAIGLWETCRVFSAIKEIFGPPFFE